VEGPDDYLCPNKYKQIQRQVETLRCQIRNRRVHTFTTRNKGIPLLAHWLTSEYFDEGSNSVEYGIHPQQNVRGPIRYPPFAGRHKDSKELKQDADFQHHNREVVEYGTDMEIQEKLGDGSDRHVPLMDDWRIGVNMKGSNILRA
jgi:hypothetical protein